MTTLLLILALSLPRGEKISMNVYFGPIKAGILELTVSPDIKKVEGIPCYHLSLTLRSTGTFSYFFRVQDRIDSYIDTSELHTVKYEKVLNEGGYHARSSMIYSMSDSMAIYSDTVIKTPPFHDPLSLIYITRLLPLSKDTLSLLYHVDKITTRAKIIPEKEDSVNGKKALEVTIRFEKGGVFKEGGDFRLWISEDSPYHEPLKLHSRLKFGSIRAVLKKYTPGLVSSIQR